MSVLKIFIHVFMYIHMYMPEFAHVLSSKISSLLIYFLGKITFTLFFDLLQSDFLLLFTLLKLASQKSENF